MMIARPQIERSGSDLVNKATRDLISYMSEFGEGLNFIVVMDGLLIPRQPDTIKQIVFIFAGFSQLRGGKGANGKYPACIIIRRFGLGTPKKDFGCGGD